MQSTQPMWTISFSTRSPHSAVTPEFCRMPGSHDGAGQSKFRRSLSSREMINHSVLESLFILQSSKKNLSLTENTNNRTVDFVFCIMWCPTGSRTNKQDVGLVGHKHCGRLRMPFDEIQSLDMRCCIFFFRSVTVTSMHVSTSEPQEPPPLRPSRRMPSCDDDMLRTCLTSCWQALLSADRLY